MLKLHFAPNSRAGRILWLLEELQLEYELNEMKFHPSDLKSDQHKERHPLGRVPVLEDGDVIKQFVLYFQNIGFTPVVPANKKELEDKLQKSLKEVKL